MDVEKLIQAAEWCKNGPDFPNLPCGGCPIRRDHPECMEFNDLRRSAQGIITVRDHYEALLNAERSKVIAEVRQYVNAWAGYLPGVGMQVSSNSVLKKLDSMEPDKEEPNVLAD